MAKLVRTSPAHCGWLTLDGIVPVHDPIAALQRGGPPACAAKPPPDLLFPFAPPEIWAAGVTYERSRLARSEETTVADVYSFVYDAERPELFLKDSGSRRTVGPSQAVAIRADSSWTVPEPELALVIGEAGRIVGATIGDDLTARDIEAVNPLYLSQAKIFGGCCAIGPLIVTPDEWPEAFEIRCLILREGTPVWEGKTSTAQMRRSFDELAAWLIRDNPIRPGSIILTGTGLVPPDDVALQPGDLVEIDVSRIGRLSNPVVEAARWPGASQPLGAHASLPTNRS